jgi:hypothetical protein
MKKFMFVNFDRYVVAESTTKIIESEKSLMDAWKDVVMSEMFGEGDEENYDLEHEWEMISEMTCVNGKQCGFDGEEESYLLIEM